jgi:hypothetical protein
MVIVLLRRGVEFSRGGGGRFSRIVFVGVVIGVTEGVECCERMFSSELFFEMLKFGDSSVNFVFTPLMMCF